MSMVTAPDPLEAVEYAGWHLAAEPIEARMEDLLNVVRKIIGLPVKSTAPEIPVMKPVLVPALDNDGTPEDKLPGIATIQAELDALQEGTAVTNGIAAELQVLEELELPQQLQHDTHDEQPEAAAGVPEAALQAATDDDTAALAAVSEKRENKTDASGAVTEKWCQFCNDGRGQYKQISEFTKDKLKSDGFRYRCKTCDSRSRKVAKERKTRGTAA